MSELQGRLETEVEIKASPEQFHEMFATKPHHVTHATPELIQGCELHEGDFGEVGSVLFWNCVLGGEKKTVKCVVEAVDPEKNLVTFDIIDGDLLKEFKSFKSTLQCRPKEDEGEGSIVHWVLEYEKIDDEISHPEDVLELAIAVSKDIDVHLSA